MDYGKISLCVSIIFCTNSSDRGLIDPSRDNVISSARIMPRYALPEILKLVDNFELYKKELSELSIEELRTKQKIIKLRGRREEEVLWISPLSFAISKFAAIKDTLDEIIDFFNQRNIFFDNSALLAAIQQLPFHIQFLNPDLVDGILHESTEHINDQDIYENDLEYAASCSALDLFIDYMEYSGMTIYENATLKVFKTLCLYGGKSGYIEAHNKHLFRDNSFTKLSEEYTLLAVRMLKIYDSYNAHEARKQWDAIHKTI
ncbi:hypothetical protein A3F66_01815 [candidate division TM6 bacterium RIFCSPHIGHO2_12_FULL_32_22]|nr:MAG: hypothetical protein A3F66_01815 [candidate division TM6 bacterium RIFCSPHIGHO2_12_FULL_32_22]